MSFPSCQWRWTLSPPVLTDDTLVSFSTWNSCTHTCLGLLSAADWYIRVHIFFFTHDKIYHNIRLFVLLCPPPPVPEWQTVFTVRLVVTVTPLRHHVLLSLSLSLSLARITNRWWQPHPAMLQLMSPVTVATGVQLWRWAGGGVQDVCVCVCVYLIMCFYEKLISSWVNPVMFYFQHVSSVLLFFFLFFF